MFTVMREDNRVENMAVAFECLKALASACIPDLDGFIV